MSQVPGDSHEPCANSHHPVSPSPLAAPESELKGEAESPTPDPESTPSAADLVQQFHREFHGVTDKTPDAKELGHANQLITERGPEFATFFVQYACKSARKEGFEPRFFGGLMGFEGAAVTAYDRHQARQAKAVAEAAEAREQHLHQHYERYCQEQAAIYRATLRPERLVELKAEIRAGLGPMPRYALTAQLQVELDYRLALDAGVPSYEDWSRQRETTD